MSPSWEALSGSPAQLAVVVACLPLTATLVSTCNDLFFLPWLVSCLSFPKQKLQPSFVGPAVFCELVAVSCPFRYSVMPIGLVESSYCLLTEGNNSFYKMKVRCLWRWWGGWGGTLWQVHLITEGFGVLTVERTPLFRPWQYSQAVVTIPSSFSFPGSIPSALSVTVSHCNLLPLLTGISEAEHLLFRRRHPW